MTLTSTSTRRTPNRVHTRELRHFAASFMINASVGLQPISKVLGHVYYKSTMRCTHQANKVLLAAVETGARKLTEQRQFTDL